MLPKGGNVLMLSGPQGNSQGVEENQGLHKILDPTHKYTFIGAQPFEVTNWDPALTQKVLSADIAKYPKIDVIVSDFGPSLVGALPEFNKSGRTIPALATSDGNVLGCFWQKNHAKNPTFKLFTVSTQNDHARLAIDWAVALASGGKKPATTHFPSSAFEDSTTGKPNPVECRAQSPGRHLPLGRVAGHRAGEAGEEVGTARQCARRVQARRAQRCSTRSFIVIDESTAIGIPPEKRGTGEQPTLSMAGITKHYDGVAALTNVAFDVQPGEVHALLGENGAGKSTLMNIASGATTPDAGTIVFDGLPVDNLTPVLAQELGVAMVHQHPALLPDLTVAENIRVAIGAEHLQRRDPDPTKAMRSLLDDVHFLGDLEDRVSSLSVARRHLLEIAKAFAVSPRLLILDEPTAPLSQDSVELLFTAVRGLAADGTAVVYITHRLGEVREIADRVTVLRDGTLRGTTAVKDISDAELLAMIVGRTLAASFPPKHLADGDPAPLLRVEGFSGHGFENISLTACAGEIVGVAGVVGNGQAAFLRALAGRDQASGSVNVGRTPAVTSRPARERRVHAGRPADRRADDRPERARELRADGARSVEGRPDREPAARGRRGRARAVRARRQGAVPRGARLRALRRKPAEGRDGARDALRAVAPRCGRADAGRRRRRPRRDLPHPARDRRSARAGRRRLERHEGARGTVRPRDRDVPRPCRRDARGRSGDGGADRPGCDQRDDAYLRANGRQSGAACRGSLASSRATTRRSSCSGS